MKKRYRLPPCPDYDVEGTESWLGDLAAEGWLLEQDGIFCGIAAFTRSQPQAVRYRLAAARESTSMWSDGGGRPDPAEVDAGQAMGWEYVANRGQFYIFRTADPDAPELDTDPQVQALALEEVRKRQKSSLILTLYWTVFYPLLLMRGAVLRLAVELGTWLVGLILAVLLWHWAKALWEYRFLRRMKKGLEGGQPLSHRSDWKRTRKKYRWEGLARWGVSLLAVLMVCRAYGVLESREVPLAGYADPVPFATLTDLAGEGAWGYTPTFPEYNTVRSWSDLLSPVNYEYDEGATVYRADGSRLSGGLYVSYHEAANEWVAQHLAEEYQRIDRWKNLWSTQYVQLECPDLEADYAVAYTVTFPTVVFRKGNIVVRAYAYGMAIEDWMPALAASIP